MQSWSGALESKAHMLLNKQVSLWDMSSNPLLRLEKAISCLPGLPSRWMLLVKALQWLNPSHPLCIQ